MANVDLQVAAGGMSLAEVGTAIVQARNLEPRKIAFVGDSITAQGVYSGGYDIRGYFVWMQFLTKNRFDIVDINGNSGQTAVYISGQLASTVAAEPDIVFVLAGSNDIGSGSNISTVYAAYDTILSTLSAAGAWVVFLSPFPRNDETTNNSRAWLMADYLRSLSNDRQCGFIDISEAIADGPETIKSAWTYDGIHPNKIGAWAIGSMCADYVNSVYPTGYASADMGAANEFPNTHLTGTTGSKAGTTSGTVPDGLTSNGSGVGSAAVFSVDQWKTDKPGNCVSAAITGAAATSCVVTLQDSVVPASAGTYYFEYEFDLTGTLEVTNVLARVQSFVAPTFAVRSMNDVGGEIIPVSELSGICRTTEFSVEASQTFFMYMSLSFMDGSGTFKIYRPKLIRVL